MAIRSLRSSSESLDAKRLGTEPRAGLAFRLFGPLTALRDGRPVDLGTPQQRALLALLLLHLNRPVSTDRLIDLLWGEEPPANALQTLRVYVSRLRRALESDPTKLPEVLVTDPTGYRLVVPHGRLDVQRFEELTDRGRAALEGGDEPDAERYLAAASTIAKSPPLAEFDYEDFAREERERLEELRLSVTEDLAECRLRLGRHAELVAELRVLAAAHPERERIRGQLMVALYRSGRQGEALEAFQDARRWLASELGVDPSRDLQLLHQQILRQDPALDLGVKPLRSYRLLERVGEGSYGVVWRAIQPEVGRDVAVKEIHPRLANSPEFIRRFEAEAQVVARLEHPHIVPLYDYWREPDGAYLVMRYLRGGSLREILAHGSLDTGRAVRLVDHISVALAAAHRQGIVHRDVKPANILFDDEGNAYLSDFGIAKELAAPEPWEPDGTPSPLAYYLSPEEIQGEPATPRTDIYSLGLVLFEALAGHHPFAETPPEEIVEKHLREPVPPIGPLRQDLPPAVEEIIQRATAKDPSDRYPDVPALAAAFRDAVLPAVARGGRAPRIEARNPYKGLRPFLEPDALDFFGRETLIEELVGRLGEEGEGSRFLAVVGPSGSGKSSVVRAGLIPALRGGALPGSDRWFYVEMTPGDRPLEELEVALHRIAVDPFPLMDELERDESGFLRSVKRILPDEGSELVLVLDQFEEVFTMLEDEATRSHFLRSLAAAISDPGSAVRVVATLRADFYDRPLVYRELAELVKARTVTVTPLTPEELERAIAGPAKRVGAVPAPALVADIVADVIDQPGALPLLQYTLTELFERKRDGMLTLEAYREIGGVSATLARRAEEIHEGLNETEREAARQLFLRLVTLGEGIEDTRRRVPKTELTALDLDEAALDEVIHRFGTHRLLSFDRDPVTRGPTVEVAHEALLREWGRLKGWIDQARVDLQMERRLALASAEWEEAGREAGFLLRGSRLEQQEAWTHTRGLALTRSEREFLEASVAAREAELAEEDARLARERSLERRSITRLRALVAVLTVAAVAAAGLTLFANAQRGRAERESGRAEQEARVAAARELAAASVANLEIDPELSILLALEAIETTQATGGRVLREAEEALHRALQADRLLVSASSSDAAVISPDGTRLFTGSLTEEAYVRDATTGERLLTLRGHSSDVTGVDYSRDGKLLATAGGASPDDEASASRGREVKVWDAATGEEVLSIPTASCCPKFSPDSKWVTATRGRWAEVWDVETGRRVASVGPHPGRPLIAWPNPRGDRLAVIGGTDFPDAMVWDLASGRELFSLRGYGAEVADLSWSPDGTLIVAGGRDGALRLWDARTGRRLFQLFISTGEVETEFGPDGTSLATGLSNGRAVVWEVTRSGAREVLTLAGHTDKVTRVSFSADGSRLATGSWDGTAKVWDVTPGGGREWLTLPAQSLIEGEVAFSPDGGRLFASGERGTLRAWDAVTGEELFVSEGHPAPRIGGAVLGLDVSPDGTRIATAGLDGRAKVWDARSGDLVLVLPHFHDPGASKAEDPYATIATGAAFSPDGKLLATAGLDNLVKVWDPVGGDELFSLKGGAWDLAYSPDGRLLAATDVDSQTHVWDVERRREVFTLGPDADWLVFSPDGARLAYVGDGGYVTILDAETREEVAPPARGQQAVGELAYSPDGALLAAGGANGAVKLLDASTGTERLELQGHTDFVADIAFSPDGTRLASISGDGTVRVWVLDLDELVELARDRLSRGLTEEECRQYLRLDRCPQA